MLGVDDDLLALPLEKPTVFRDAVEVFLQRRV
jgi:hypothetical protein